MGMCIKGKGSASKTLSEWVVGNVKGPLVLTSNGKRVKILSKLVMGIKR